MDCLFCKIVSGVLPSHKVYEDDDVLAFLDISPVNYGHTLVIPKNHFKNFEETPEEVLAKTINVVKKVGKSLKDNLGVAGYNVYVNNDSVAGQIIPHIHFHVIPRRAGDGLELWPQGKYGDGEIEEMAQKLRIS